MALKFRKVARKALNGDEKGTTKYYAAAKRAGVSGVDKIRCAANERSPE
ncbi:MAG: hypothetical protein LBF62_00985 [Tannerellaceae bacterium]|jgi:hypothetical protein|nr:hypothetical protein [Tannerellaceae bacterium]